DPARARGALAATPEPLLFLRHTIRRAGRSRAPTRRGARPRPVRARDRARANPLREERPALGAGSPPPPPARRSGRRHSSRRDAHGRALRSRAREPARATRRLGQLVLRSFDTPPHARLATLQSLLVMALVARFARDPRVADLQRWGPALPARFPLPAPL